MNEIEKARQIQNDCIKNHLIPPILGILNIKKIDKNKKETEITTQKSNSYVRNAYNIMGLSLLGAYNVPESSIPTGYSENEIGIKRSTGGISRIPETTIIYGIQRMEIGSDGTPDGMSDYKLLSTINNLTSTNISYTGSLVNKKLTVNVSRTFINMTSNSITAREVALFGSGNTTLLVRDVFEPVTILPFEGITITYTLEMLYP